MLTPLKRAPLLPLALPLPLLSRSLVLAVLLAGAFMRTGLMPLKSGPNPFASPNPKTIYQHALVALLARNDILFELFPTNVGEHR